jgi:hypothetical protein
VLRKQDCLQLLRIACIGLLHCTKLQLLPLDDMSDMPSWRCSTRRGWGRFCKSYLLACEHHSNNWELPPAYITASREPGPIHVVAMA